MSQQPIKRFIAGAVCPACSAMDTIKMYEQNWSLPGTPQASNTPTWRSPPHTRRANRLQAP